MSQLSGQPEFSRPLALAAVGAVGRHEKLAANEAERAALADRLGLLGLDRLEADLEIHPEPGGSWRVNGTLRAEVVQSCVVSLEPVPQKLLEALDWRVTAPGGEDDENDEDADLDADGPDPVEAVDGVLDMGEAVAQSLSLALDPYPRSAGATLDPSVQGEAVNPFAKLAALKKPG